MSKPVGPELEPRLLEYFAGGRPVLVAMVRDSAPTCLLGRGLGADKHNVSIETDPGLNVGDRVSIHTLGPDICALLGNVTQVIAAAPMLTVAVHVEHVKDDRPPGLEVRPFEIVPAG